MEWNFQPSKRSFLFKQHGPLVIGQWVPVVKISSQRAAWANRSRFTIVTASYPPLSLEFSMTSWMLNEKRQFRYRQPCPRRLALLRWRFCSSPLARVKKSPPRPLRMLWVCHWQRCLWSSRGISTCEAFLQWMRVSAQASTRSLAPGGTRPPEDIWRPSEQLSPI